MSASSTEPLDLLKQATVDRRRAEQAWRDALVGAAGTPGLTMVKIAETAGVTRQHAYNLVQQARAEAEEGDGSAPASTTGFRTRVNRTSART